MTQMSGLNIKVTGALPQDRIKVGLDAMPALCGMQPFSADAVRCRSHPTVLTVD